MTQWEPDYCGEQIHQKMKKRQSVLDNRMIFHRSMQSIRSGWDGVKGSVPVVRDMKYLFDN